MDDRETITETYPDFDMRELFGVPLEEAANYLLKISKEAPPGARLEDTTYSHDPTVIDVRFDRAETDGEYSMRKEHERMRREVEERSREQARQKEARRKQFLELKKEFGGY